MLLDPVEMLEQSHQNLRKCAKFHEQHFFLTRKEANVYEPIVVSVTNE